MTASDHLNGHQFMDVRELLNTQSSDALIDKQRKDPKAVAGPDTTVRAVYADRARHMAENPARYGQLDEHLRSGTIDPVWMAGGAVYEGHHRIVRAHQLGVQRLPVSASEDSQAHLTEWLWPEIDKAVDDYHRNRGAR